MNEYRSKEAYRLVLRHYGQQLLKSWKYTTPSLVLTGIGTILVFYVPPLVIAKLLSRYAGQPLPDVSNLAPYLITFSGLWLVGEICWRVAVHFMNKAEADGIRRLYNNAMLYMLDKDLAFFHDNFAGSLTKKTVGYANRYIEVTDTLLFNISPNAIPMLFVSYILWQYSPVLVFALIGIMTITLAMAVPLIKRRRKLVTVRETASNKVSGYVADIYSNVDAVRAFGNEKFEKENHRNHVLDYVLKSKKSWDFQNQRIDLFISPIFVAINLIGIILALEIARNSGKGIEAVFVTFSYYAFFTRFLWEFNSIYRRLETALSDAAQFTELLLDKPKIKDADNPVDFKANKGMIEFKNVKFQYEDNDKSGLFEDFNLQIMPGQKVGLVGHSGGGKTTLTKLILRFMDIESGEILIDGQDISKVAQSRFRAFISYVPQDPYMFHRSIEDNIRYGKLDADKSDILAAAKASHSQEFIEQMPEKYDTLIGERGVKLSGGQRQRIAIARAMIKDAPILLLDEATSALDSESEKYIQDALWKLMKDKTAIVIAHRLSTIQRMDRIIVMEEGRIVEDGSHKELLENKGIYAELWKHQSGGFLED
ncbi:MAG TPA: ABC transporter ATP-binding protein [Candidatus Saccharimonadales bacterium]|nr:ABC transporter ATP-binding protein [Candidatus Saccharimonadales bacterium]